MVIFSAGNGHLAFPACIPDVIAVGGVTVQADGILKASSYASSFRSQLYPGRQVPDVCGIVGESSASPPLKGHIARSAINLYFLIRQPMLLPGNQDWVILPRLATISPLVLA